MTMDREHSIEMELHAVPRIGECLHILGSGNREWGVFRKQGWWEVCLVARRIERKVSDSIKYVMHVQLGVRPADSPWITKGESDDAGTDREGVRAGSHVVEDGDVYARRSHLYV